MESNAALGGSFSGSGRTAEVAVGIVAVFERGDAAESLCGGLERMNYGTIRADDWESCLRALHGRRPLAAVIGDTMDRPFALAADLPGDLPKILVSADRALPVRQAALRAGFDAVLPRPFAVNELLDWLEPFDAGGEAVAPRVLVLADRPVAAYHAAALEAAGLLVTRAGDAAHVMRALDEGAADLLLMDMDRPGGGDADAAGVDGVALARMVRQNRRTLSMPFVFLAGGGDEERHAAAVRHSGGGDVVPRSIDRDRLVELVRLRADRARSVRAMIERDSLTGLLRHGHFMAQAAEALAIHRRTGTPCSFAMVDIDHFKSINDRFGHPAGDQVIRTLARGLAASSRTADVIGRCGGEEFGILFTGAPGHAARAKLDRVRGGFAATPFGAGSSRFAASFSAGVAADPALDLPGLMRRADAALYQAKLEGRGRVQLA